MRKISKFAIIENNIMSVTYLLVYMQLFVVFPKFNYNNKII